MPEEESALTYIKGVGPKKAELLEQELGLRTNIDILFHFPFRYIDKTKLLKIADITPDSEFVYFIGKIVSVAVKGSGGKSRYHAQIADNTGKLQLVWFKNVSYFSKNVLPGMVFSVYGKVSGFKSDLSIVHPELKEHNPMLQSPSKRFEPIYPLTERLKNHYIDSKFLSSTIEKIFNTSKPLLTEFLPVSVRKPLGLPERNEAIRQIHFPENEEKRVQAEKRLKFEEMFVHSLRYEKTRINRLKIHNGLPVKNVGEMVNSFYQNHLSFELTEAQKKVIKEIRNDMGRGYQMNRLIQGDVGSGKTVVALFAMLLCVDNQYQSCMMAPTEILAIQHYLTFSDMLFGLPIKIALLTGSTSKKDRQQIIDQLKEGEIQILVGTHALLEDDVIFKSLGLVIIDEQHKFGVAQRAGLWRKYTQKPHVLVMTATPIPRTLAMTIHGELDVSVINELPKGRKPVKTVHKTANNRYEVMDFVKRQIKQGRQIYIVYPLIEESSALELNDLMNGYEVVCSYFPIPEYQVSIIHGKMKPEVKEYEMKRFKDGITQIMVSTTVIEVGVNVPNASVMIIENANRFGLSQLHQLRGRVGRGADQSYCILMTDSELNYTAKKRIKTMCDTSDGFAIAKTDLELRGPGDVLGTRQSGLPDFKILDLVRDEEIIDLSKRAAAFVLNKDPELQAPENAELYRYLVKHQSDHFWSRVS